MINPFLVKTVLAIAKAAAPKRNKTIKAIGGTPLPSRQVIQDFDGVRYGTFWELWGGHGTADHVHTTGLYKTPEFCNDPVHRWPGFLDVCLYGVDFPKERPREPLIGEAVYCFGYPGGSTSLSARVGKVYYERDSQTTDYVGNSYIVKIDNKPKEKVEDKSLYFPVIGGMSGGLCQAEDGTPLGFLVTLNGGADLDNDGVIDYSFDFYSLADVWDAYNDPTWDNIV